MFLFKNYDVYLHESITIFYFYMSKYMCSLLFTITKSYKTIKLTRDKKKEGNKERTIFFCCSCINANCHYNGMMIIHWNLFKLCKILHANSL